MINDILIDIDEVVNAEIEEYFNSLPVKVRKVYINERINPNPIDPCIEKL